MANADYDANPEYLIEETEKERRRLGLDKAPSRFYDANADPEEGWPVWYYWGDEKRTIGSIRFVAADLRDGQYDFIGVWNAPILTDLEYLSPANETYHVIEGTMTVTHADGEIVTAPPGSLVSFSRGDTVILNMPEAIKLLYIARGVPRDEIIKYEDQSAG